MFVFFWLINNSEKVMIPKTKPNITFQGQGYTSTAIAWNNTANSSGGTFYSGSVQVFSDNFIAKNISFMVRAIHIYIHIYSMSCRVIYIANCIVFSSSCFTIYIFHLINL